eukprot:6510155-Pyramimonas_sp.AAC.1
MQRQLAGSGIGSLALFSLLVRLPSSLLAQGTQTPPLPPPPPSSSSSALLLLLLRYCYHLAA